MKNKFQTFWLLLNFWLVYLLAKSCHLFFYLLSFFPKTSNNKVLYLETLPFENAGYQYRSFKWKKYFTELGWQVQIKTITESRKEYDKWLEHDSLLSYFLIHCMWVRLKQVVQARNYQIVIVRRELLQFNDYGNLFMEKLLLLVNPTCILDFDDDISAAKREPREIKNWIGKILFEQGRKFQLSLQLYPYFIMGNKELEKLILKFVPLHPKENRLLIPTCIDYTNQPVKLYDTGKKEIVIGWIGGIGNLDYLNLVMPALEKINKQTPVSLLVVSGLNYQSPIPTSVSIINSPWGLTTEVADLLKMDIGIMPLPNNQATLGKSGFKLLQYMGLGIVPIASAVGINREIINDSVNGFLVEKETDWLAVFEKAISKRNDWASIGKIGQEEIKKQYTFEANYLRYHDFLKHVSKAV